MELVLSKGDGVKSGEDTGLSKRNRRQLAKKVVVWSPLNCKHTRICVACTENRAGSAS